MDITTKYIKIAENNRDNNNFIKVSFYYDLGGYNYFTYTEKKRGYYVSVTPVERSTRDGYTLESVTAFTGYSELLQECARKSAKAEKIAAEKLPAYEKMIISYICNKYNYFLEA